MAQTEVYPLTPYQNEVLTKAALSPTAIFVVLDPCNDDGADVKNRLRKERSDVDNLLEQGLVIDVSANFQGLIATNTESSGRSYRVCMATQDTIRMFRASASKVVN